MRAGGKRREEIFFNLWKFFPAKALEHRAFRAIAAPALRGGSWTSGVDWARTGIPLHTSYFSLEINPRFPRTSSGLPSTCRSAQVWRTASSATKSSNTFPTRPARSGRSTASCCPGAGLRHRPVPVVPPLRAPRLFPV